MKKLPLIFLCLRFLLGSSLQAAHLDQLIQERLPMAMAKAGGHKDFYSAPEIKAFNLELLSLIGLDHVPSGATMMLPGTKTRFLVSHLERLKEGEHEEGDAVPTERECAQKKEEALPLFVEEIESVQEELIPQIHFQANPQTPTLGDIYPETEPMSLGNYSFKFASDNKDYVESVVDENGNQLPYGNKMIDCEDCPSFVGSIQLSEPDMGMNQQCSGTLVEYGGRTLFFTNRHCIPEDMKEDHKAGNEAKNCDARISVTFPKTKSNEREVLRCQKLVEVSAKPLTGEGPPDWAIIELEKTNREPAKLAVRDILRGEEIELFPMYYDKKGEGLNGGEERLDKSGQKRWFNIVKSKRVKCNQLRDMNVIGSEACDQEVTSGNSGSGAFNKDGNFSGVLSHIVPIGMSAEEYAAMVNRGEKLWSPAFIGTTSRDILRDIYVRQLEDPNFRVYPMSELKRAFPHITD